MSSALWGLLRMAARNAVSRPVNLAMGGLLFLSTLLLVVGGAVLTNISRGMTGSVVETGTGHFQLHSTQSSGTLDVFEAPSMKFVPLANFPRVRQVLLQVENVRAVEPESLLASWLLGGNPLDRTLERLREAVRARQEGRETPESRADLEHLPARVRHMAGLLRDELSRTRDLMEADAVGDAAFSRLDTATSDAFWAGFASAPYDALEFLENQVAPLAGEQVTFSFNQRGMNPQTFEKHFPRLHIVSGTQVPPGQRGLLMPWSFYERALKLKVARNLDELNRALTVEGRTLAEDPELQRLAQRTRARIPELLLQWDALSSQEATARLQKALPSDKTRLEDLLTRLLTLDDANFPRHYQIFYAELAPLLELYRVQVGDLLAIKALGRNGSPTSVPVKMYGVYRFEGLEEFIFLDNTGLLDLASAAELYGAPSAQEEAEREALTRAAGLRAMTREEVEAKLLAQGPEVSEAETQPLEAMRGVGETRPRARAAAERPFSPEEMEKGPGVLTAAVLLSDAGRAEETLGRVREALLREKLAVAVVPWAEASGPFGQFTGMVRLLLYAVATLVFLVVAVILNNTTLLAMLRRMQELGTLRAIGASRHFILGLVLAETGLLTLAFSLPALALGAGVLRALGRTGIPAPAPAFSFFFGGPRLFPTLGVAELVWPWLTVLTVTLAATLLPALRAARVPPVRAMQSDT